jgi:hypothetical protein
MLGLTMPAPWGTLIVALCGEERLALVAAETGSGSAAGTRRTRPGIGVSQGDMLATHRCRLRKDVSR